MQIFFQLFAMSPCGSVDPLEHFITRVAAPVRACNLHQLKRAQVPSTRNVGATAEIQKITLLIQGDIITRRNGCDNLSLIPLAHAGKERNGIFPWHRATHNGEILSYQFGHPCLDRSQIVRRKRAGVREVVIEPIFYHGPNRNLCFGKELFHRLREEVRGRVADHCKSVWIIASDNRDPGILINHR